MILGTVIGTVWATRKSQRLEDRKLAIVRPCAWYDPGHDVDHLVAVDQIGARVGQDVLICVGQPGRWMAGDQRAPIEASVMGIVDRVDLAEAAGDWSEGPRFSFRDRRRPTTLRLTAGETCSEVRRA